MIQNQCKENLPACKECQRRGESGVWYWNNQCHHPDKLAQISITNRMMKPQENH